MCDAYSYAENSSVVWMNVWKRIAICILSELCARTS